MHSKSLKVLGLSCLLGLTVVSCGVLGKKDQPAENPSVGNQGCLNNSKDLVKQYIAGQTTSSQWKGAFDCVNQSVDFFTQYVQGSTKDGYTQSDMYMLITRFLLTNNNNVHHELMAGAFHLKTALFGGDTDQIKLDEVRLLQTSLSRLRDITADLIPYLKVRNSPNPDPQQLLEMVSAFKRAGDQLGDFVSTLPTNYLTESAVNSLLTQVSAALDIELMDGLGDKVFLAKWILLNNRRDAVETGDWPLFFKNAMSLGGIALAFTTAVGPNDPAHPIGTRIKDDYRFREVLWDLALQAKPYLADIIARHDGVLPFPVLDHVIDALPAEMLDNVPKDVLKQSLRPMFRRLFLSDTQMGFDQRMLDTLYSLGENAVRDLGLMDRFYEKSGIDPDSTQPAALNIAMNAFAGSLNDADDQVRFARVKASILAYKPLFLKNTGQIYFDDGVGYSRYQNLIVVAAEPIVQHLLNTYAANPNYFVASDLVTFFGDYNDILFALKMIDKTVSDFGPKRLQDMDLFTPVSNGNQQGSLSEVMNYAMMVISAGTLTDRMRAEITPVCDAHIGDDLMGWTWVNAACLRTQFHKRLSYWIESFPHLKRYWATLSIDEQNEAMKWIEHGSRRNGYSEDEIGKFDFGALAAILNYTESLFMRFDTAGGHDAVLQKSEISNAFPVFKTLLAEKAKMPNGSNFILKGIFTYIVRYREMPETGDLRHVTKLGWWLVTYFLPTTHYSADRAGVFNIVCQLAVPENADSDPNSANSAVAINKRICQ